MIVYNVCIYGKIELLCFIAFKRKNMVAAGNGSAGGISEADR